MRRLLPIAGAVLAAMLGIAGLAGCAVRTDGSGVSRVGIGLWGFGDPPGVHWNLDWPRRDEPQLPPARRPEFLPTPPPPASPTPARSMPDATAPPGDQRPASAMDDNGICAHRCIPASPPLVR